MNAIDIVKEQAAAYDAGKSFAVVTIVQSDGSTPRSSGKMIVYPDGSSKGTVGGGAVELLAIRDAQKCIQSSENAFKSYDLTSPSSDTGMTCGGHVSVLIEVFIPRPLLVMCGAGHVGGCMLKLADKIPAWAVLAVSIAAAVAAGAVWALIPALFKARFGTNETLFTLMMNYIAIQLVSYFSILWAVPKGSGQIGMINATTKIGWLPQIGNKYLLSILIAAVLTLAMFIYLKYSKHGYEISVVGESENTARYIGINVKKVVIRTMLLSGAVCGLAGALLVLGIDHTVSTHTVGGQGFTAILVSWLGKFNPFYMILTSFLIIFLQKGAGEISSKFSLNDSFSEIITGIIIFFIIGCEFFINYRIVLRAKAKPMLGTGQSRAKGGQA